MLTAEQKIRETLSQNMWRFQHEGPNVIRWITGGTAPDAYVTFGSAGDTNIVYCSTCGFELGSFDLSDRAEANRRLDLIREYASEHQRNH